MSNQDHLDPEYLDLRACSIQRNDLYSKLNITFDRVKIDEDITDISYYESLIKGNSRYTPSTSFYLCSDTPALFHYTEVPHPEDTLPAVLMFYSDLNNSDLITYYVSENIRTRISKVLNGTHSPGNDPDIVDQLISTIKWDNSNVHSNVSEFFRDLLTQV